MECSSAACELPVAGKTEGHQPRRPNYCDVGSVDQFALAGLHAAIRMLRQHNMEANLACAHKQIQRMRGTLERIERLRIFGAPDDGMPSLAVAISGFSSGEVASQLRRHRLVVGSGIHCAPLAHETLGTLDLGLVRLSVGVGQPDEEIDEAMDRLRLALNEEFCQSFRRLG